MDEANAWAGSETMTDVRLDHALLACHACRWRAAVSHEHQCVLKRGYQAGDQLDHGRYAVRHLQQKR